MDPLVYGKDKTRGVIKVDARGRECDLWIYDDFAETVVKKTVPNMRWILFEKEIVAGLKRLEGNLTYKYVWATDSDAEFRNMLNECRRKRWNVWANYCPHQQFMLRHGVTNFKGMKFEDLSVLSFDIETTGLDPKSDRVLMISSTFKRGNAVKRRLFSIEDYPDQVGMILAWCGWVNKMDPDVICGHNVFGFDFPFLMSKVDLPIGRDGTSISTTRQARFRRDGSQFYEYKDLFCSGRHIIDTFFVAIKTDTGREFDSYGLKPIVAHLEAHRSDQIAPLKANLGITDRARQHLNAALIRDFEIGSPEWVQAKQYAQDDADDSLLVYLHFLAPIFYYTSTMPINYQDVVNGASGGQINSLMCRSYLQDKHSLPQADESAPYEGAISFGNPGVYRNVYKVDVASLYPSIIIRNKLQHPTKDPKGHFFTICSTLTETRLAHKARAKDPFHKASSEALKIIINSMYGYLGTGGLNFNWPEGAAKITAEGRDVLMDAKEYAESKGWCVVGADTDSIAVSNQGADIDLDAALADLNKQRSGIVWEDDGVFDAMLVVKAKNYAMLSGESIKIKGSALKGTYKESRLADMMRDFISCLLEGNPVDCLKDIYNNYVREIRDLESIEGWASKKTVTDKVFTSTRTNETKIMDALNGTDYRIGDKVYVYFKEDGSLGLAESWSGDHCVKSLLVKVFKTACIFDSVAPKSMFTNYSLKKNRGLLGGL